MKKLIRSAVLGVVLALLAACLNPVEFATYEPVEPVVVPAESSGEEGLVDELLFEPFVVTLYLGEQANRSVVGLPSANIGPGKNLFNYSQVIVLDSTGAVVYFGDNRQSSANDTTAIFNVTGINDWTKQYTFLMLMGHWERTLYTETGAQTFGYKTVAPTLLGVGQVKSTPSSTINISMAPITVDTKFDATGYTTREPGVGGTLSLTPVDWTVQWTLQGAGFTNLIGAEGKTLNSTTITDVFTASSTGSFNSSTISGAPTAGAVGNWTLSKDLSTYTTLANGGKSGYVNFNLTYVPFKDKTWDGVSVTTPSGGASGGKPRWIIRNGINDTPQDTNTSFTLSSGTIPWNGTKNGNGAVNFTVALDVDSSLGVSGQFTGSSEISYTTTGYTGTGDVYYAATSESSAPAWSLSNYKLIGDDEVAGTYSASGSSIDSSKNGYVILVKDGKMSSPAKLTKQVVINPTWP